MIGILAVLEATIGPEGQPGKASVEVEYAIPDLSACSNRQHGPIEVGLFQGAPRASPVCPHARIQDSSAFAGIMLCRRQHPHRIMVSCGLGGKGF